MATVYILRSGATGPFYIGSTNDVQRRVEEHLRGHSLATRGRGPWELVYQETFELLADARRREIEMKRWKSAKKIAELIAAKIG